MFVFGMLIALLGTLFGLPEMRARLGIDLARQGDLFGAFFVGLLASTAAAGPILDRVGCQPVLLSASVTVGGSLLLLAVARGFPGAALAAVLLGVGGGWLNTATNALVSDIYADDRGRMFNLLGIFFGVGALSVPLVVTFAFGVVPLSGMVLACAAVAGGSAVAYAVQRFPPPREGAAFSLAGVLRTGRDPGVWLFAALLFFESGNEASISGWTSTYVRSVGWSAHAGLVILLGYWTMAIAGRALSARWQARVGKSRLVIGCALLSVAGCLALLSAPRALPALAAGAWGTSLGFSAIVPTTLALVGDRYHRFAGSVFGFLFTVGNVGSMAFPWALGHISAAAGVRFGMVVPLVGTVAVTLCAVLVARRTRR
jgi:MFS family permease